MKKCILIIGPESSGSTLIAKTCAIAIDPDIGGEFNSGSKFNLGQNLVIHKSLPEHLPPKFPDIIRIINEHQRNGYKVYIIICTRDITISQYSRVRKFLKPYAQTTEESERAKKIILEVIDQHSNHFIWSYESFMFLGKSYLNQLYQFLDLKSDYVPKTTDGNKIAIEKHGFKAPPRFILRLKRRFRIYSKRFNDGLRLH